MTNYPNLDPIYKRLIDAEERIRKINSILDDTWKVNLETGEAIFEIKHVLGWEIPEIQEEENPEYFDV